MKRNTFPYLLLFAAASATLHFTSCSGNAAAPGESRLAFIDTRVGTAASSTRTAGLFGKGSEEFGQTLPAVLEPNGMNFWTPQTRDTERKCKAPYYYADSLLQGFRNSHWIVGGCTQDYGSMTLMPLTGTLRCQPEERATVFSHETEVATPAYYSVELPAESIKAEMTGTSRAAIFRLSYSEGGKAYLVVNPNSDEGQGSITVDTLNRVIYGSNPVHRIYQGWGEAAGFSGHFVINYSKDISGVGVFDWRGCYPDSLHIDSAVQIGAYIEFDTETGEEVLIKAASSFVSCEGAAANLAAEIPHWNFERVRRQLTSTWEKRLSLLQVETDEPDAKEKFYGAFYRTSFLPRTFNDVDGRYPSFGGGESIESLPKGQTYYEDYSMWDTYRALHPLVNLISPTKGGQMVQSLVYKYLQAGWLPVFPCWNSYTAAMIGDHCISAICDAYAKGIRNFDVETAYEAMRQNAFQVPEDIEDYRLGKGRRALNSYMNFGYIPLEDEVPDAYHKREQTSRTLEYAYDDFVLAQLAYELGKEEDHEVLMQRALNYRNVIDPATGYAQGRSAETGFLQEDNAFGFASFITEGAPCHYTWYVPHDPYGLMDCMGGKENYVAKLDSMFAQQYYWHGNEPCHQVPFMFNYAGQPYKTQKAVRHIMETEYFNAPGGLAGNDDAGQMSAWYIFAAMGFYPVCPGSPYYMIASPSFPSLSICPEGGKRFTIKAEGASAENIYIQSATLNGKAYTKNYIHHNDILRGGTMVFVMGPEPSYWGTAPEDCPPDLMHKN